MVFVANQQGFGFAQKFLLKQVIDESTSLPEALEIIEQAKAMIKELKTLLPESKSNNFRERLVAHLEYLEELTTLGEADRQFQQKARELLLLYRNQLAVKDLFEKLEEDYD